LGENGVQVWSAAVFYGPVAAVRAGTVCDAGAAEELDCASCWREEWWAVVEGGLVRSDASTFGVTIMNEKLLSDRPTATYNISVSLRQT